MEGQHDNHVSATLIQDYVHTLDQAVPIIWFNKSDLFPNGSNHSNLTKRLRNYVYKILKITGL